MVMAKAYSYDFRQKVIESIELNGLKQQEASELFNISRNTINLWFQQKAATGDFQAKTWPPNTRGEKITDWAKFRAFAQEHHDRTQVEMAELWLGAISARTISRALAKIGFTRKKKPTGTANAMKQSAMNSGACSATPLPPHSLCG